MTLNCAHCGSGFEPTVSQWKKRNQRRSYCSPTCRRFGMPGRARTAPRFSGICQECASPFESKYPDRKFCTMTCYVASSQFKEHVENNLNRIPAIYRPCMMCGKENKDSKKFCNQRCYRSYMAGRFDRWVAAPQGIALPQGYDEFLDQIELHCLIDGCEWKGNALSNHVNFAHGIPAKEFKRAAGFNLKSGLVSADMAENLSNRAHIYEHQNLCPAEYKPPSGYKSLEGKEHSLKSRAISESFTIQKRNCDGCGAEYQPKPGGFNSRFHSIDCREATRKRNGVAAGGAK